MSKTIPGVLQSCRELPRSDVSFPIGAADRLVESVALGSYGFVESEYEIKGFSNVCEWPEGKPGF